MLVEIKTLYVVNIVWLIAIISEFSPPSYPRHEWQVIKPSHHMDVATNTILLFTGNPLSPNIHIQILQTDLHTFS